VRREAPTHERNQEDRPPQAEPGHRDRQRGADGGAGRQRGGDLGQIIERSVTVPVIDGSQNNATVDCQAGEVVIGGGNDWSQLYTNVRLQRSLRDGNGWNAAGSNNSGATRNLTVYAYCFAV
jgi:hypothetical protein